MTAFEVEHFWQLRRLRRQHWTVLRRHRTELV